MKSLQSERNQTHTPLFSTLMSLISSVLPTLSVFFLNLKCYLYLLLLSSLSRNCRYNQLCKYAVVSNLPPSFCFLVQFIRETSWVVHPCFFVLNSKHMNGFWRRGSAVGRGNKEAFSWDAFTSKFLLESHCHPCGQRLSFGLKGSLGNPLNAPSECIKAHSKKTSKVLVAICLYRLPSQSRTPENVPVTGHVGSPPSAHTLSSHQRSELEQRLMQS